MSTVRQKTSRGEWRLAGGITALGAIILGIGLLLGPTPEADPSDALRDIAGFRTRFVLTNMIDFVGSVILMIGLLALARLQATLPRSRLLGTLAGAWTVSGGVLVLLTLIIELVVVPAVAERFVQATGDPAMHLAVGEAVLELDGGVFGLGFMLLMGGIAAGAIALLQGAGPPVNRVFLLVGAILAGVASPSAIAYLFEATQGFGRLEPYLGLSVLVWLVAQGVLLWRTDHPVQPTEQ